MRIYVHGAKGGVGCTTLAALAASTMARRGRVVTFESVAPSDDRHAVLGLPQPYDDRPLIVGGDGVDRGDSVVDVGTTRLYEVTDDEQRHVLVLRNDYLALRHAAVLPRMNHVVCLYDQHATLTIDDVEAVLGAPVLTIALSSDVARAVDAGTLGMRMTRRVERELLPVVAL